MKTFSDEDVVVDEQSFSDEDVVVGETQKVADVASSESLVSGVQPTNPSNFLEVSPAERAVSFGVGGPAMAVGSSGNSEDVLPMVMGSLGGIAGTYIGKPNVGLGVGTAAGDLMKQSVKKLQGEGDDIDVKDSIILGGMAAAGGKALESAMKIGGVSLQLIPERARAKLFDKALQAVNIGKKQLSRNWERSVAQLVANNPDQRVNLRPVMKQLSDQVAGMDESLIPQLKTAVKNNPELKRFVNMFDDGINIDQAIGVTLKEANNLKNAVTSATNTILKKAVKGKTLPSERVVLELVDKFDDAITSAFPQMAQVRYAYKQGRQAFDLARPLVEPGTAVEGAVLSKPQGFFGLGGTQFFGSTQGRLAAKDVMSQTVAGEKLFGVLKSAHNINRFADAVGRLGQIAVGGSILRKFSGEE